MNRTLSLVGTRSTVSVTSPGRALLTKTVTWEIQARGDSPLNGLG